MKKILSILKEALPWMGTILFITSPFWLGYGCSMLDSTDGKEMTEKEVEIERRREIKEEQKEKFFNQYENTIFWDLADDEFKDKFTIDLQEEAEQSLIGFMGDVTDIQKINGDKYITIEMESPWFTSYNGFIWDLKCDKNIELKKKKHALYSSFRNGADYGVIANVSEIKKVTIMVPTEDDEGNEYLSEEEQIMIKGECLDISNINQGIDDIINIEKRIDSLAKDDSDVENYKDMSKDDRTSLIFNYSEAYCLMRISENLFWKDYYSDSYRAKIDKDDSDIPTMRELGNIGMDNLRALNTEMILAECEEASLEGCKPLTEAFSSLIGFLGKSSELESFEEFKAEVSPELDLFRKIIKRAPSYLQGKFEDYHDELEIANKGMLDGMEEACNVRIQEFQGGMSYQPKNKEDIITYACFPHSHFENDICVCDDGYAQSLDNSSCVKIPTNAHAVDSSTDVWLCDNGYVESSSSCIKRQPKLEIQEKDEESHSYFSEQANEKAELEMYLGAIKDITHAITLIEKEENSILNNMLASGYYRTKGRYYEAISKYEEAINSYDNAIFSYPDNHLAYALRGWARILADLDGDGEMDENFYGANRDLTKAIEIKDDEGEYYRMRGFARLQNLVGYTQEDACSDYDMAISLGNKKAVEHYPSFCE